MLASCEIYIYAQNISFLNIVHVSDVWHTQTSSEVGCPLGYYYKCKVHLLYLFLNYQNFENLKLGLLNLFFLIINKYFDKIC
jgi:hypothetical protein